MRAVLTRPRLRRQPEEIAPRVLVNSLSQAVVVVDAAGRVVVANEQARAWCGLAADGDGIGASVLAEAAPQLLDLIAARRATEMVVRSPRLPLLALRLRPLAGGLMLIEVSDGDVRSLNQLLQSALKRNATLLADNQELRSACEAALNGAAAAAAAADLNQDLLDAHFRLLEEHQRLLAERDQPQPARRRGGKAKA